MSCCNNYQQNGINQLSNAIASLKCDPCPIRLYPCYKGLTLRICVTSLVLQGSNLIVNFSIEKCGKDVLIFVNIILHQHVVVVKEYVMDHKDIVIHIKLIVHLLYHYHKYHHLMVLIK